jgi:hypothetical protein
MGLRNRETDGRKHHPWMVCKPLCASALEWGNATLSHTSTNVGRCCMTQLAVCLTAIHQRILLHTLWCCPLWPGTSTVALFPITFLPHCDVVPSGPGHPLWLFSQSHSFLATVFWPSWHQPHPQRWMCGVFAWLHSQWLSKINPQGNIRVSLLR